MAITSDLRLQKRSEQRNQLRESIHSFAFRERSCLPVNSKAAAHSHDLTTHSNHNSHHGYHSQMAITAITAN